MRAKLDYDKQCQRTGQENMSNGDVIPKEMQAPHNKLVEQLQSIDQVEFYG